MKIGIVCCPTHGGSGVVATELGKQLAKRGHEVHFFSYQVPFRLDKFYPQLYFHEVEVPTYPLFKYPPYSLALASKIAEVVEKEKIDIIHVHYAVPHSVCGNMARDMVSSRTGNQPKVVSTLHGTDITLVGNHPSFFPITKFGMENSDALTCVSKDLEKETRDIFGVRKQISTIYNFIDYEEYRPIENNKDMKIKFAPNDEKLLIHISNFRPVKRVEDVIRIFYNVQKEVPSRLIMVGDGSDRIKAEQLAKDLGITNQIDFLGKQDQIKSLLSIADLLLLPSEKESFGLVALEAMAYKIPVIASQVGGIPEVVLNNETGFVSPLGDINKMAKDAIYLLKNPEELSKFGLAARKRVIDKFSVEKVIPQYEELYIRTLKGGN
ncbi:N-acetyl-alpha-D-glucosaminyl L-malate synthase BshA [Natranaerobius trueperi]|uniref:N-acetyl-alpha-D-glucosaminyl L-malate synthase BshA n=1 Tax=Natranaerobius trueperi TaxID=759412 RepID=A0A226BXF7_9FIRM|nr:N-acetyl-alpha-D-glucosaminyl L-malate synthase BshA [Natranaerobius trueperi]